MVSCPRAVLRLLPPLLLPSRNRREAVFSCLRCLRGAGAPRRQPAPAARIGSPVAAARRDPLQAGAVPLSPMRPPPTPGRVPPASPAMPGTLRVRFRRSSSAALADCHRRRCCRRRGGGDWRGGNPNALPPAEPDEPPIGSFALDHLPPAQLDDFSRIGRPPPVLPSTDSDTMAALNARKLRATERSGIDQQQWYFGSILRDDAAGLIANLAPGAFIVRTSSQPNSFALTFKHKSGEIQHGLLREVPQGWSIEGAPPYEATLEALLKTHNGLNYNLVPQVRANYAQKYGGGGGVSNAPPPASLVAQDEYPIPDNQLAAAGAPPPLTRRPSMTGGPSPRGGLALSPAPLPRANSGASPARAGGVALPPPLVSGKSSPNLGAPSPGSPQQPQVRLCEICSVGRAVSRVKVAGQSDLKLCCSNCLDMHVVAPMRAQLAERKMHVESIERQFGNKPKDKVALHQLMQLGLEIAGLQEQLTAMQRK
jgi:hypothetical protein